MKTTEWIEFVELLRQLPEQRQRELYLMIKGAVLVSEIDKPA